MLNRKGSIATGRTRNMRKKYRMAFEEAQEEVAFLKVILDDRNRTIRVQAQELQKMHFAAKK